MGIRRCWRGRWMSKWGTYRCECCFDGHVAPCTDEGDLLGDHILTPLCPCEPQYDRCCDLWVHNDRERGGSPQGDVH